MRTRYAVLLGLIVLMAATTGCVTAQQAARNTVYAANRSVEALYEEVLYQTYIGNLPAETEAKADALYDRYWREWKVPAARAVALYDAQTTPQTLAELELMLLAIRRELAALMEGAP